MNACAHGTGPSHNGHDPSAWVLVISDVYGVVIQPIPQHLASDVAGERCVFAQDTGVELSIQAQIQPRPVPQRNRQVDVHASHEVCPTHDRFCLDRQ